MTWDDVGFLLSKSRYNENSIIVEIFTKNHGKVPGIIFGGTSKKIKNYLQIGNKIHINFNSKSENRIGYFKVEIQQVLSPIYFDNPKKLLAIISAINLVKILTAEFQKNEHIFDLIENFFIFLKEKNWIQDYIFWELELFRILGYDLEFKDLVDKEINENESIYVVKTFVEKKIVPSFLVEKSKDPVDLKNLLNGLNLVGNYLDKTILKPNNLNQPITRTQFINSLK